MDEFCRRLRTAGEFLGRIVGEHCLEDTGTTWSLGTNPLGASFVGGLDCWNLLGSCLSVNRVGVYLNNHGTGFIGPNQTNNSFGTQRKLKLANSSFEFAD